MSLSPVQNISPSDRRLIKGYGPAVLLILAFLVMAFVVPSIAPEKDVTETVGTTATTSQGTQGAPTGTAGSAVTGSGSKAPSNGAAGAAGSSGNPGTTGGKVTTGSAGTPTVPGAKVKGCSGKQVPGDPYSPPCTGFSGSNGGATSPGVTSKDIVLTYMNPTDGSKSVDQSIEAVTGSYNSVIFPETYAQMINTLQDLVTYFNAHFQFYGRKIVLKVYNGSENTAGDNQGDVQADALNVSHNLHAFAEINGTSAAYANALTAQHVLNFSNQYTNYAALAANAPYSWSYGPTCTQIGQAVGATAVKGLVGKPTSFGGTGVPNGQKRKFAVVYDDLASLDSCAKEIKSALASAGQPAATNIAYSTDVSVATATAQSTVQQLINDKITTVLCMCDPVGELLFADDMSNDHYLPEWVIAGVAGTETDDIAQEMPQDAWAHVVDVTSEEALAGKYGSTLAYFAAKSEDHNNSLIVNEVDPLYERLYQLALGIQLAGPDLTPQTYAAGMYRYKGATGPYGPQDYVYQGQHEFNPTQPYRIQWYDPAITSQSDGAKGAWVSDNTFYSSPPSPLPIFPHGPQ